MASAALKSWIKSRPALKQLALWLMRLSEPFAPPNTLRALTRYLGFFSDLRRFRRAGGHATMLDWYPCLHDKSATTGYDAHYLHQSAWVARRIYAHRPIQHADIASQLSFVAQLAAITQVVFVDLRPPRLALPGLTVRRGLITELPFESGSVASLSCLHVIEHIGLGRYGDPIDPRGPERACAELARVAAPAGMVYVSVPIGRPRVQFNGQRVFAAADVPALFGPLTLREFAMVDALGNMRENIDPAQADIVESGAGGDYGLGMFLFTKPSRN